MSLSTEWVICRQRRDILTAVRDGQRTIDSDLLSQFGEAVRFLEISAVKLREGVVLGSGVEIFHRPRHLNRLPQTSSQDLRKRTLQVQRKTVVPPFRGTGGTRLFCLLRP